MKPKKLLAFSDQKCWVFLPGIGSPGKVGNNGIQIMAFKCCPFEFTDGMGVTLPQLCQNYLLLSVESVNCLVAQSAKGIEFIQLMTDSDTHSLGTGRGLKILASAAGFCPAIFSVSVN
jgi:hypothetical protein